MNHEIADRYFVTVNHQSTSKKQKTVGNVAAFVVVLTSSTRRLCMRCAPGLFKQAKESLYLCNK